MRLPVLPASDVRAETDMFRCLPYAATISAGACVQRQARAAEAQVLADERFDRRPTGDYTLCIGCALGGQVGKALGATAPKPTERRRRRGRGRRACSICGDHAHDRRICPRRP